MPKVNFSNVQGNILKGFNKPNFRLIFFKLTDIPMAKEWLRKMGDRVPSTNELIISSNDFKKKTKRDRTYRPQETWLHVSLTAGGIRKLGKKIPISAKSAFNLGMKKRAIMLGDIGQSSPKNWIEPFKTIGMDGLLIVASDQEDDADASVSNLLGEATEKGIIIVGLQNGKTLKNELGKNVEHFGFRDGVSQPLIAGIDDDEESDTNELFKPDNFVLTGLSKEWANEGSFLVFRRLKQDVNSFWNFVRHESSKVGLSPEALASKFVGRWDSGAPLAKNPDSDPNSPIASDDNEFEYMKNDPLGLRTPRFSHIRKVYPRDDGFGNKDDDEENDKHRILRRGIPFGKSIGESDNSQKDTEERGLLFMCYQSDISSQFEYIQIKFANNPGFPKPYQGIQHGHDPIIGLPKAGAGTGFAHIFLSHNNKLIKGLNQWVVTTGGEYFFSPSISSLKNI
jgi:Dyp-type peroxidase family